MSTDFRPVAFMLISTFTLSFNGLIMKFLSGSFSTEVLGALRFIFPALIMLTILKFSGWVVPDKTNRRPIIIRSLCVVGSQLSFITALNSLTLVESVVLFSTGPLFIPLLEKLFYKTPIQAMTIFNLGLTFTGVLLQAGSTEGVNLRPELLIGLAAGGFNAMSQVSLFKGAKSTLPAAAVNGWCFLLAALILAPVATLNVVQSGGQVLHHNLLLPDASALLIAALLLLLATCTAGTQMFRAKAYKLATSSSELAPLIFTNFLFAIIWQVMFFNEEMAWNNVLGISLIILATLINTFYPRWVQRQHAAKQGPITQS
ncbi:EamA family transporter [Photobacterium sanctipauli]|uniref:EamA family transporter n=1 Tax=Photobacterium sanctipauli TaxID=1342794 RepID=A0A2T3P0N2_9GAMM|nr:DMT family transporter [Photobacterium sanctipauli]PSW22081.1 EamA family transporter [Photobacterium sanctipauli]